MNIELKNIAKRFNKHYIFKNLDFCFETNKSYAITGKNGSGKSTLLQIIYGFLTHSEGEIIYKLNQLQIAEEDLYQYVSFTSPYLELPEDFTLNEIIAFHFGLTRFNPKYEINLILHEIQLAGNEHKYIKQFSSGMKQKLKLLLAMFADTPLLLLDEPTTNLDDEGMVWYKKHMQTMHHKRTIVIASNQPYEYDFCDAVLKIDNYK